MVKCIVVNVLLMHQHVPPSESVTFWINHRTKFKGMLLFNKINKSRLNKLFIFSTFFSFIFFCVSSQRCLFELPKNCLLTFSFKRNCFLVQLLGITDAVTETHILAGKYLVIWSIPPCHSILQVDDKFNLT